MTTTTGAPSADSAWLLESGFSPALHAPVAVTRCLCVTVVSLLSLLRLLDTSSVGEESWIRCECIREDLRCKGRKGKREGEACEQKGESGSRSSDRVKERKASVHSRGVSLCFSFSLSSFPLTLSVRSLGVRIGSREDQRRDLLSRRDPRFRHWHSMNRCVVSSSQLLGHR